MNGSQDLSRGHGHCEGCLGVSFGDTTTVSMVEMFSRRARSRFKYTEASGWERPMNEAHVVFDDYGGSESARITTVASRARSEYMV